MTDSAPDPRAAEDAQLSPAMGDEVEYRAVSKLAVAGFALCLVGLAAIFEPLMAAVAALAAIVCGLAVWQTDRSEQTLSGRWLAVGGLVISLLVASSSLARVVTYRYLLVQGAQRFCRQWFDTLAAGNVEGSIEMFQEPLDRAGPDTDLKAHYQSHPARQQLLETYLRQNRLVNILLKGGANATVDFANARWDGHDPASGDAVHLKYSVVVGDKSRAIHLFACLDVKRTLRGAWQIFDAQQCRE